MRLLTTYGSRSRRDSVTQVDVVSATVVKSEAKFYDLRTGSKIGQTRKIELGYARDGRLVRRVADVYHVIHPDGRSVALAANDVAETPVFVGDAVIVKDDRYNRTLPCGVYDTSTGALRGRLEQRPNEWNVLQPTFVSSDDRTLWTDDVTSLRCWDLAQLTCTRTLAVPDGFHCFGVAMTSNGNLATWIRPPGGTSEDAELIVLDADSGKVVARRKRRGGALVSAGGRLVISDPVDKRFVILDGELSEQGSIPMPGDGSIELVPLWSGQAEFIAIDGFNQFHHYGEPSLGPSAPTKGTPAAKKPAAKKPAAKKPAAKKPAAKRPAAKKRR